MSLNTGLQIHFTMKLDSNNMFYLSESITVFSNRFSKICTFCIITSISVVSS